MPRFSVRHLLAAAMAVIFAATGAGVVAQEASPTPDGYGGELVKDVLVEDTTVDAAPGETLSLTRYIIPAGAVLPVHYHPGVQMASVEAGVLTYHVVDGELPVTRADGTLLTVVSGETVELAEGDSWIEPKGMIHFAENRTDGDVILISTALLDSDEPATIVVDLSATPEATPVS
jgi:quercetin dioxygenase-like cupin family protein